jgi:hypothetical protein
VAHFCFYAPRLSGLELGIDHWKCLELESSEAFRDDSFSRFGAHNNCGEFASAASEGQVGAIEAVREGFSHVAKEQASPKNVGFKVSAASAEIAKLRLGTLDIDIENSGGPQLKKRPSLFHAWKLDIVVAAAKTEFAKAPGDH